MTRDQERHRFKEGGHQIKPRELNRISHADNVRYRAAEEGSWRLLMAIRRYFVRHHVNIGLAISGHEADKARGQR